MCIYVCTCVIEWLYTYVCGAHFLNFVMAAGKVKTTGEIYKHKMQVNEGSSQQQQGQQQGTPTPPAKGTESSVSDVSTASAPPMPSLDETRDTPVQQQQKEGEGKEEEGEGGGEDTGGTEEARGEDTTPAQEQ